MSLATSSASGAFRSSRSVRPGREGDGMSPPLGNWLGRYYASLAIDGTPRVGKWGAGPCGPFGVRASRSANPIASRRAHPANASPSLRAFQPVTCRFSMLLWLGEESPRPPLPKADPKHSRMRNALSAAGRRGARGGMVMEPFCQPSELPQKIISLGKRNEFQHDPLFSRVSFDCRSKKWGYSKGR